MTIDPYKGMPGMVRVGGFLFDIVIGTPQDHEQEGTYGHMNSFQKRISVRPGMCSQQLANTFIHEVIHAIHWDRGLVRDEEEIGAPSEEEYTMLLANGLCAFWQDNPHATKWWAKTITDGFK